MAEGGEFPKIIINARGEEKSVVPAGPEGGEKLEPPNFEEIQAKLKEPGLPEDEKRFLQAERTKIVDDVQNFEDGRFLDDVRLAVITRVKESRWDQVYNNLQGLGKTLDEQLQNTHGANLRWKGVIEEAVDSEAAKVIITGIESRDLEESKSGVGLPIEWFKKHGYSSDSIRRYRKSIEERHLYDLLPDVPEGIVGELLNKKVEPQPAPPPKPDAAMNALLNVAVEQRELTQEQLNALQRGFGVLVGLTETRTAISPDTWESQPPYWYEKLPREEKEAVKTVLIFNYISGVMEKTGEAMYGPWAAIGDVEKGYVPMISAESLAYQWKEFPGYRVAVATMTDDLFEKRTDGALSIRSDTVGKKRVDFGKGYDLMSYKSGEKNTFIQYKKDLISALVNYYEGRPDDIQWALEHRIGNIENVRMEDLSAEQKKKLLEGMATLMVSMADNFLMGTTSYLSGDMKRPYDLRNNDGGSFNKGIEDPRVNGGDDIRAFLNPGLRLWKKIIEEEKTSRKEEYTFGTLGEWIRYNAINNIDGFRDDFIAGKIHYVPDKFFPGMLEFTILKTGKELSPGEWEKQTAANILINKKKVKVGGRVGRESLVEELKDYEKGANDVDFRSGSGEWFGIYNAKRVQAVRIYENMSSSGGQRTSAIPVSQLFNYLVRLRKMECIDYIPELQKTYWGKGHEDSEGRMNAQGESKDFVIANLAQIISEGNGPILGIREIVLNIDPRKDYDTVVNIALSGQANIFEDDKGQTILTRKEALKEFNANDTSGLSGGALLSAFGFSETPILSKRENLRRKAKANIERLSHQYNRM